MRRIFLVSLAVVLGACSGDGAGSGTSGTDTDFIDDQPPNGCDTDVCTTGVTGTGTGATTGAPQDECQTSADCDADQACVAEFTGTGRGVFRCVDVCLANMNEAMWCADAAACCSADAICTDRGYCVDAMDGGSDTGTSTGTGTGTGG